jgi:elongation factor P
MLEYNEITVHKYIIYEDQPYEVLDSHVFRKQQRKPVNAVKMRNMITGNMKEVSFHVTDKVNEAELSKRDIKYLYTNRGEIWFCEVNDPSKRFKLSAEIVGDRIKFMKPNSLINALIFEEQIIGVEMPIKVDLKVTDAPPAVKGDTAKGGNKQITLETGAIINAPLFINPGDIIRINTETGEYTERLGGKF